MLNFLDVLEGTEFIYAGIAFILVLVMSLSLHEFGHAFIAYKNGDMTPKVQGRVTLNPLAHIDPIGFLCCALFGFGWAKPVEINPLKFRKYKTGLFFTSIAGVTVNLILAFIGGGLMALSIKVYNGSWISDFFLYFSQFLFYINISLFIFNLLPVYPLDGFNCIAAVSKYDNKFVSFMRKYGNLILIILLVFGDTLMFQLTTWVGYPIIMFWSLIF
ncbi:MAG TPA: site-2 protease family protein [Clostridiales bacterium]|nr:site-2 protease family protein [Clostridiales bacterium]